MFKQYPASRTETAEKWESTDILRTQNNAFFFLIFQAAHKFSRRNWIIEIIVIKIFASPAKKFHNFARHWNSRHTFAYLFTDLSLF